jgi:hypothetical protein
MLRQCGPQSFNANLRAGTLCGLFSANSTFFRLPQGETSEGVPSRVQPHGQGVRVPEAAIVKIAPGNRRDCRPTEEHIVLS